MNILMVGPDSNAKGGMATVIKNFKDYYSGPNKIFYLNSWTERLSWLTGLRVIFKIRKMVKNNEIDIVHFHIAQKGSFYRKSLLARMVKKDAKIIFHMHASQFDIFYNHAPLLLKKYIRNSLDQSNYIVALSDEWRKFYSSISHTRVIVIENAVKIPEHINYNSESNQIITLGRLGSRKGTYDILQVATSVQSEFPEIKFILYGDGKTTEIRKKIKHLGLSNVKVGGWLDDDDRELTIKNSLIHLLPSYHEGLPMSVLETMAYGIPNIATNIGGIPQVIKNHSDGVLVLPGKTKMIEQELINLLENRYKLINYSKLSRDKIKTNYSLTVYFDKWNSLYRNLIWKSAVDWH